MKRETITLKDIDPNTIINEFIKKIPPSFNYKNYNGGGVIVVFDYYYYRIKSKLSATIIFDVINQNECRVHVIISGGSGYGFSLGAEKHLIKQIKKFLQDKPTVNYFNINLR
ncbi:MAG: hypothetical protein ACFFBP_16330 [Promethearchaeota archaeon]